MPSSGSVVVKSRSLSVSASASNSSNATSFIYKTGTIPPVLTAGAVGSLGGAGGADITAVLPASVPTALGQGETITLLEQPQKLSAALREVIVWQLEVPYTSELPPGDFGYAVNPMVLQATVSIPTNTPTTTGLTAAAWSGSAPPGLSIDSAGNISGTPPAPAAPTVYTITATKGGGTVTAYVLVTVRS